MRLSPPRFAFHLSLGIVLAMVLVQGGAALTVEGIDRSVVVRAARGGAARTDADGGHAACDLEGATPSVAEQAAAEQGLALGAALPAPAALPTPPHEFSWLPELRPSTLVLAGARTSARGRAPPAV